MLQSLFESFVNPKPRPDVGGLLSCFEIELQIWMSALKDKCIDSLNPRDSEVIWSAFRKRLVSVSLNLQDVCVAHALENISESVKVAQLNVTRLPVRLLENVYDIAIGASSSRENAEGMDVEDQVAEGQTVVAQNVEDFAVVIFSGTQVVEETLSSEQPKAMKIEHAPSSSVAQTLNELKKENEELKNKFD